MGTKLDRMRETLAHNVKVLMDHKGWSQPELARRSGVSQRSISDLLGYKKGSTTTTIDRIAAAFGLDGWVLLVPGLPKELLESGRLSKLVGSYSSANKKGREYIDKAAEVEARYSKINPDDDEPHRPN